MRIKDKVNELITDVEAAAFAPPRLCSHFIVADKIVSM